MNCKCGAKARKTECGFTTTIEIWWCDVCKDEVTEFLRWIGMDHSQKLREYAEHDAEFTQRIMGQFAIPNNGGYNEADKKEYFRLKDFKPSFRSTEEKLWLKALDPSVRRHYFAEWKRHRSNSRAT